MKNLCARYCKKYTFFLLLVSIYLVSCTDNKKPEQYPMIDIINNLGNYQRVYCSDIFSSLELVPLETKDECFADMNLSSMLILNDSIILMRGHRSDALYAFDRTGKFINEIGRKGQGPQEYLLMFEVCFNTDKSTIYIFDYLKLLEYNYNGTFIRSYQRKMLGNEFISHISYIRDGLFIGSVHYDGKNRFKYCIFNQNGDTIKTFPNYIFFNRAGNSSGTHDSAFNPIHADNRVYLKDYINDTIYTLNDLNLEPAYVFNFSKYSFSKERLERSNPQVVIPKTDIILHNFTGFPNYFFYSIGCPESFSWPEAKPEYDHLSKKYVLAPNWAYGLYNISENKNILLDTDQHLQRGIINDINGGFPFVPRYYVGNNEVADVWFPFEMKEIFTDEYFASQTIKDQQGYKKLRELLKNMEDDDNPVVVIAKLK